MNSFQQGQADPSALSKQNKLQLEPGAEISDSLFEQMAMANSYQLLNREVTPQIWEDKKQKLINAFPIIRSWNITGTLLLKEMNNPGLVQMIQNIRFPFLQILRLEDCGVESIDNLCRLYIPLVNQITLDDNLLVSISQLRKCELPHLNKLSISNNKNILCESLTELRVNSLSTIGVEFSFCHDPQIPSWLNWVAKIEAKSIGTIYYEAETRIKQAAVLIALRNKYNTHLTILTH